MTLAGKHIIVGVTGSIAAYKAAMLVRLLVKAGAEVRVIMTPTAKEFISPLTLATLSANPILVDFFDPENGAWNSHVDMGIWADALLIAPATANTIAKMATGVADNLLLTTYLSARCPVMVAPAMDMDMYAHAATQANIQTLAQRGVAVVEPASGTLASGLEGKGRMEEPEIIVERVADLLTPQDCAGKRVLVTVGPTREPIDPVRFISNYSTGRMGYAIAEELARRGAEVTLVSGPVVGKSRHPSIHRIDVQTAAEMYAASTKAFEKCDAAILTAAVADFTPTHTEASKIKDKQSFTLALTPTDDIAAALGRAKRKGQLVVGFALETDHEVENAQSKLSAKNLDMIVLNSLNDAGAGFGYATNKVTVIDARSNVERFELKDKTEVAKDVINKLLSYEKN